MKFFVTLFFFLILTSVVFADENFDMCINCKDVHLQQVEAQFRANVNVNKKMYFTYVPRGLIVSMDESIFFNDNEDKISPCAVSILDTIGEILKTVDMLCVVEGHTEDINPGQSRYKSNWELSLARANNIVIYFIKYVKIAPQKLAPIGFGEFMPFVDNVSDAADLNKRIDFVIIHYDEDRGKI